MGIINSLSFPGNTENAVFPLTAFSFYALLFRTLGLEPVLLFSGAVCAGDLPCPAVLPVLQCFILRKDDPFQDFDIKIMESFHAFPVKESLGVFHFRIKTAVPELVFKQLHLQPGAGR